MIKIANISEIPIGGSKVVMYDEMPIALFNINGKIIAWDNRCPHRGRIHAVQKAASDSSRHFFIHPVRLDAVSEAHSSI